MSELRFEVSTALMQAWGKQEQNDRDLTFGHLADAVLVHLRSVGYRVVNPAEMAEDCEDPWVCCIHEPPEDTTPAASADQEARP